LPIIVTSLASVPGTANVAVIVDETDISSPVTVYVSNPDVCCCEISTRWDDHADILELIIPEMTLISTACNFSRKHHSRVQ
jgi:hypothetical protein